VAVRYLSERPFRVSEELLGSPLASPARRGFAFAVDCAILVLPSVAVALAAGLAALAVTRPASLAALRTLVFRSHTAAPAEVRSALRELAPLLVDLDAEGLSAEIVAAVRAGDLDAAAAALEGRNLVVALSFSEHVPPASAAGAVRFPLERLIPAGVRGLALYGVAALYFGVLTRGRRGATLGKRVAGIRVVRLDGERLTFLESLERFVGYLHIPGSLFIGLGDLWRDPNRRPAHDRVAHTVVLRNVRAATPGRA